MEPWVHIFIIFMSVVPSVIGVCLGMFNNVGNVCYGGNYFKGCKSNDEIECERGEHSYLFTWLTSGWLVIFFSYVAHELSYFVMDYVETRS